MEVELVLNLGSGRGGRGAELVRLNHFVGLERKFDRPEGEAERLMDGNEGDDLVPSVD